MLKDRIRRVAVGGGILALALAGIVGTQSAAMAEGFELPDPEEATSLTIHKYEKAEQPLGGQTLAGVGFTIQRVGVSDGADCTAIDLFTLEGWDDASAAVDAFTPGQQILPAGYCLTGSVIPAVTEPDGTVTIGGLQGLYWVVETDPGEHMITDPQDPFLVAVPMPVEGSAGTWDYTVDAYPKNLLGDFTPTKTVTGTNVDGSVVVGAIVPWEISTPIPAVAFPYHTIIVTDNVGANHTFEAWGEVTLNGTLLVAPGETGDPDYTVAGNVLTLTEDGLAKVNAIVTGEGAAAATLVTKLTTKVTGENAVGPRPNDATVTLNGQTGTTPEPVSNWGKLVINKHLSGNTSAGLQGAEFAVFEKTSAGCAADVTGTAVWVTPATPSPSPAQQSVVLWISNTMPGVAVGSKDYCLLETKAPTGHLLDSTPREVTISSDNDWVTSYDFPNVPVEVPELPLTGSTGSLAFAFIGFGLIGTAGVLFAIRRARSVKQ